MKKRDRLVEWTERVTIGLSAAWFIWSFMLLAILLG